MALLAVQELCGNSLSRRPSPSTKREREKERKIDGDFSQPVVVRENLRGERERSLESGDFSLSVGRKEN